MNFLNNNGVMPISGFYGPHIGQYVSSKGWKSPDYLTDKYYEMIKESGINLISYSEMDYAKEPSAVLRALQLAEKYNLCMYVVDSGITSQMSVAEMAERMKDYCQFKSFKGLHICDEPSSDCYGPGERMLDGLYELATKVNSFPELIGYANLFAYHPDWIGVNGNTAWRTRDCFESYVDDYCKGCNAKMLSQDYYIFDAHSVETSRDYFENLEIMKIYAQKYDIPFWVCIQLGGQWNDESKEQESKEYFPHPKEVVWNVNTSLAAGAKGITYFPLLQPIHFAYAVDGEMDFKRNGLITANGEKSIWFDCVKQVNEQIKVVGKHLMKMTHKAMIAKGHYAEKNLPKAEPYFGALRAVELVDKENQYGAVIGCFAYGDSDSYYIVNNDTNQRQEFTLQFDKTYEIKILSSGHTEEMQAQKCNVSLEPSEAHLLILK